MNGSVRFSTVRCEVTLCGPPTSGTEWTTTGTEWTSGTEARREAHDDEEVQGGPPRARGGPPVQRLVEAVQHNSLEGPADCHLPRTGLQPRSYRPAPNLATLRSQVLILRASTNLLHFTPPWIGRPYPGQETYLSKGGSLPAPDLDPRPGRHPRPGTRGWLGVGVEMGVRVGAARGTDRPATSRRPPRAAGEATASGASRGTATGGSWARDGARGVRPFPPSLLRPLQLQPRGLRILRLVVVTRSCPSPVRASSPPLACGPRPTRVLSATSGTQVSAADTGRSQP